MSVSKVLLTRSSLADLKATLKSLQEKQKELSHDGCSMPARSRTCAGKLTGDEDECRRESLIFSTQIEEIESVLRNYILVYPATSANHVGIGTIVTFQRYDSISQEPIGREETYEIGCYRTTDLRGNLPKISYDAPLAAAMRGLEVGDTTADITIKGKKFYLDVLKIELTGKPGRDDEPTLPLPEPSKT